jgi:Domain of unknown function (DUF4352)
VRGWRTSRLILAVTLPFAVLVAIALGGCQISQDAIKKDPFLQELVAAAGTTTANAQGSPTIGKPYTLDNTQWTIEGVDAGQALQFGKTVVNAKGSFLVVRFVFENLSSFDQPPESDMLVLESGSGKNVHTDMPDQSVTAQYAAWTRQADFLKATLKPNTPYKLALVFDVPAGAGGMTLTLHSYPDQNENAAGM